MRSVITITSCSRAVEQSQGQYHWLSQWTPIWLCRCDWWLNRVTSCNMNLLKGIEAAVCAPLVMVPRSIKVIWRGIVKIFFSKQKHCVKCAHHPTLMGSLCQAWAHPAYLAQFNPTLFFQLFHSLHCRCSLILPRAEHSSPCSNTASRVPLLVEILPFSFAFSLCFNFHSKCVCSAPTSGMQSHFFPNPAEEKMMHCPLLLLSSPLKDSRTVLWRNWSQLSVKVELIVLKLSYWCLLLFPVFWVVWKSGRSS